MNLFYIFLILVNFTLDVKCWDSQQLEVFDVVEEVKENFYRFLEVKNDASLAEIKSAFRKLSLELHPDKNPSENADEQFRQLVAVYEVLKNTVKRQYYDEVLINGLPNWRSAVYYYRHVRRIGLLELCLFLFVFISVGQYLVAWASYLETIYTLEQVRGRKQKKIVATYEVPKPSALNTLPIQIPKLVWSTIKALPWMFRSLKEHALQKLREKPVETSSDEEPVREHFQTVRKRKPGFIVPDGPTFEPVYLAEEKVSDNNVPTKPQVTHIVGGLWTDDDLSELAQLINRYPGGTPKRWEIIAEATGRSVAEITYMSNKLKATGYRLPTQNNETEDQTHVKVKTKGVKLDELTAANQSVWSQEQQRAIENALAKYPKGCVDRWDCIADCVPGKTKDECMIRFKYLVELVKKQKGTRSHE